MKNIFFPITALLMYSILCTQSEESFSQTSGTFTDPRDGQDYKWVKIGDQLWMAENLKYLPSVTGPGAGSETVPHYYVYNYWGTDVIAAKATDNYQHYGVLYNWPAVMSGASSSITNPSVVQGVCPSGWFVPSDAAWTQLIGFAGSDSGTKLKETSGWTGGGNGTDAFGFSAIPGGYRPPSESFGFLGSYGYWWSATEDSSTRAWFRGLYNFSTTTDRWNISKGNGFSLRCVRDFEPVEEPPIMRDVRQETIESGESACFDALQTINVSDFTVQTGGSANFIAGQKIIFGPGTAVQSGGYLHAYITQTGNYCTTAHEKAEASVEEILTSIDAPELPDTSALFRVFPNPTDGSFTLELGDPVDQDIVYVEVYSVMGNRVISHELPAETHYALSLADQLPGLFIVRVIQGDKVGARRIIKR